MVVVWLLRGDMDVYGRGGPFELEGFHREFWVVKISGRQGESFGWGGIVAGVYFVLWNTRGVETLERVYIYWILKVSVIT